MARKDKAIPVEARAMDLVAAEKREVELTAEKALELYGDGLPYERLRYMEEVKSFLDLTQKSIIEAGKRLIILKTKEKHGGWLQTLEQIGIPRRTASRFMDIARRFGKWANLAHLNTAKIEALEDLTEAEVEDLNDGKDVLGINLDDIDCMTATQLRGTVREGRKQLAEVQAKADKKFDRQKEKHEQVVREMSKELEALRLRDSNRQPLTKEQKAAAALAEFTSPYTEAVNKITQAIREAYSILDQAMRIPYLDYVQLNAWVNQFMPDMNGASKAWKVWLGTSDEARPMSEFKISDLDEIDLDSVPQAEA